MSVVEKLEESIKKLVEYKFPMDEVEQATILNDCDNVLEEFVAFKKDYDSKIHVPRKKLEELSATLSEPSEFITEYGVGRLSLALELLSNGKLENIECPLKSICQNVCCYCGDVYFKEIIDCVRNKDFCFKPLDKVLGVEKTS